MAEVSKLISKSSRGTQKIGRILGESLRKEKVFLNRAFVIALRGNLGAGKTTFVQGLAQGLGVKEKIKSPSFAILKIFDLPAVALAKAGIHGHLKNKFIHLLHFDFYRLDKISKRELEDFKFFEFLNNPRNLIIVEWSEKIKNLVKNPYLKIEFKILKNNKRELIFSLIK